MRHNKVVNPKGKKQKVKGPGTKMRNLKHKELGTSRKVVGGAKSMMFKGKKVYGK